MGFAAMAGVDHLWKWTGRVETAMSSSNDPSGGNYDYGQFHGKYKGDAILAKITGPGCIYRVWSAWPSGTIRFYLDGANKPEIECDFKKYLEGECQELENGFSVGRTASYLPVPFEKSAIVTAGGFHIPAYYQVSYQTYDSSVKVSTFRKKNFMQDASYQNAASLWAGKGLLPGAINNLALGQTIVLNQGQEVEIFKSDEPGIIRNFGVVNKNDPTSPLSDVKLVIRWDDRPEPAVNAPVDAFFMNRFNLRGNWPGGRLHNMFITTDSRGYRCRFPMPFNKARISLVNSGPERVINFGLYVEKVQSLPEVAMRFHAEYREKKYDTNVTAENTFPMKKPLDPATNYVVLDRKGRGHYIGCAVYVAANSNLWWGEGDEMTYIDGASRPQILGTGTEDEFNWSWGYKAHMSPVSGTLPVAEACEEPLVAQVIPVFRNSDCVKVHGENVAYRLRPSDYVPFRTSIKVTYEILGHSWITPNNMLSGNLSQTRGDDWASVAYWYEAP